MPSSSRRTTSATLQCVFRPINPNTTQLSNGFVSPPAMLLETGFPTLDSLREFWNEEEQAMRAYLAGLTDDDINGTVRYKTTKRVSHQNPLWHLLAHVVNHGTQFRGEAAVALTAYGQSPGDLDLIFFLRAMPAIPAPPA